jgi:alanine-glyoxylate transaminase/serine-glyoxylate transaminase/serine-pyruvate transaminase
LKGKVWRIGLMGETSTMGNVRTFLGALGQILNESGRKTNVQAALSAAN